MTAAQFTLLLLQAASLLVLLAGLAWHEGHRICRFFLIYVLAVLATDAAYLVKPELFRWQFYVAVETLHAAVKFGLAAELGWRLFAQLPGARATLGSALLLVTLATLFAVLGTPLGAGPSVVAKTALPYLTHGTAWVFGALLAAKLYYRIPAHPLHAAVLRGFVPFLLTFTVALGLLDSLGWGVRLLASYGYTLAYQALLLYWIVVVWRRQESPNVPPQVLRTLQPWR